MGAGKNIKFLLQDKNIKQKDFAEAIGETTVNVTRWLSESRGIPEDVYNKIAKFLNVSLDAIMGNDIKIHSIKFVPITGNASCGSCDINTLQDLDMKQAIGEDDWSKELYAVIANGDSMATEIYDGDICIVDPTKQVQNGDMVLYKIDDESAIKVYYKDEDNYLLNFIPFNSSNCFKIKTIRLDDEETKKRLIYHKVVFVVSAKKNNRAARLKMIGRG